MRIFCPAIAVCPFCDSLHYRPVIGHFSTLSPETPGGETTSVRSSQVFLASTLAIHNSNIRALNRQLVNLSTAPGQSQKACFPFILPSLHAPADLHGNGTWRSYPSWQSRRSHISRSSRQSWRSTIGVKDRLGPMRDGRYQDAASGIVGKGAGGRPELQSVPPLTIHGVHRHLDLFLRLEVLIDEDQIAWLLLMRIRLGLDKDRLRGHRPQNEVIDGMG